MSKILRAFIMLNAACGAAAFLFVVLAAVMADMPWLAVLLFGWLLCMIAPFIPSVRAALWPTVRLKHEPTYQGIEFPDYPRVPTMPMHVRCGDGGSGGAIPTPTRSWDDLTSKVEQARKGGV